MYTPEMPKSLQELDIPVRLVEDLILRYLYSKGDGRISELSSALKLSFPVIDTVFQQMRQRQLFEVTGLNGKDYAFTLSGTGREHALNRMEVSLYTGPAPVALANYFTAVRKQTARIQVDRLFIKNALSDLVLPDALLDQLGPALISQNSIFLYGPTGNGKTSIVKRLLRVFEDAVLIPYAVEFDGQIIVLYDPAVHERIETNVTAIDPRWVLCRRPCILVGGELEPKMLELQMEEASKVYAAPLQMRANNGILIIDDFGRQILSPQYLLNRWIVPLDRRVDYLTLRYGVKFRIPFEMMVVFSTNLDPDDLADEAFLRRIQNKIYVAAVQSRIFDKIFFRILEEKNIPSQPNCEKILRELCLNSGPKELRACYPRDIIDIIISTCKYESKPLEINEHNLLSAVKLYFTKTMNSSNSAS
ncbi:MAG: AAA family ATPase [Deltaproteobacteria bacterium]|nr:AAA family ATPase [Deltaproteobacteria bacterium]